jgi:hypothetical protein
MTSTEPAKDRYPYAATWKRLTPKQQRKVRSQANKARLPIPAILSRYVKSGQQP